MLSQPQQLHGSRSAASDGLCCSRLVCRAMPHCSQRQLMPARLHTASPNVRSQLQLGSNASRGQVSRVELSGVKGPGVRRRNACRGRKVRASSDEQQKEHGHSQQQRHPTERPDALQQLLQQSVAAVAVVLTAMAGPVLVAPPAAQAVLNSPNAKIARSAEASLNQTALSLFLVRENLPLTQFSHVTCAGRCTGPLLPLHTAGSLISVAWISCNVMPDQPVYPTSASHPHFRRSYSKIGMFVSSQTWFK